MARTKQTAKTAVKKLIGKKTVASNPRTNPVMGGVKEKKRRFHPGTRRLMNIRREQKSTKQYWQHGPFLKKFRDICHEVGARHLNMTGHRVLISKEAIHIIKEVLQQNLVETLRQAQENKLISTKGEHHRVEGQDIDLAVNMQRKQNPKLSLHVDCAAPSEYATSLVSEHAKKRRR